MPVPNSTAREHVLRERRIQTTVDNAQQKSRQGEPDDGDGVGGGRRTLKRNKTFTAASGRQQQVAGGNGGRRHRRGTKGRYTVPLLSAPAVNSKYTEPLYIQTSHGIFEEAFGDGKRNSLSRQQVDQLTAALALPERRFHKQVSPTTRSTTSSSGFGSTDALATHSHLGSSKDASPRSDVVKISEAKSAVKTVNSFHFWILLCIQYVMHYLRRISAQATRRRLETTPTSKSTGPIPEEPSKNFIPVPSLSGSRRRRVAGAKRKLHFEDEVEEGAEVALQKQYYTELHLGRENQRSTTLAAVEAEGLEYRIEKLIDRASETKFITTVFEIRQRGLEEIAGSVKEEMQRWYGEHEDDLMIVCCEVQWSTPDRYRNVIWESRMKDDLMSCLRTNNRRVLNTVAGRNEKARKSNQFLVLPDSVTEEAAGRRPGAMRCWGGSYRRYYGALMPWGHREAASEHQPWWEFKKHAMPESIDWPLIASIDKTSVIILNMVCLKLDQL